MKAYAVNFDGCYFLAYAPTASKAKGLVIRRYGMSALRCRRWPELDRADDDRVELLEWGYPGSRDWECGNVIETPDPFKAKEAA